jgi:predicted adenylyl cyclase CyaB
MFEVEAKVPITGAQYKSLMTKLKKEGQYLGFKRNRDIYYEKSEKTFTRIRERNGKPEFDLKLRRLHKGIESNIEMEWEIKDLPGWKKLLKRLNIRPYQRKTKKSEYFKFRGFIVELNEVSPLGRFLEIERVVKDAGQVEAAKKELVTLFKSFGFAQKEFEERPYLELLANV